MRRMFPLAALVLTNSCSTRTEPLDVDALRAPPDGSALFGRFEGRVPCGDSEGGCQRIKVTLTLHQDAETEPTAYVLEWIYVGVDDERHVARGTWTKRVGTPWDAAAVVYELSDGGDESYSKFAVIGGEVLLFLDAQSALRLGDAGHAYVLTRTAAAGE